MLLRGARQTGKTFLLRAFGAAEYEGVVYCNFEEDPGLESFFRRDLDPHRIVAELAIYLGRAIRPERDLIVFDEIQASNLALSSLKYFQERAKAYHVAAAGSLLGIRLSRPGGKAELDFLREVGGTIVPIEVKAGLSHRSKSLKSYAQQLEPEAMVRTNLLNLNRDGKICNIPLYAIALLDRWLEVSGALGSE